MTSVAVDPELMERVLELSGERTKEAALTRALTEFVIRREQQRLPALFRRLVWDNGYDYKRDRSRV